MSLKPMTALIMPQVALLKDANIARYEQKLANDRRLEHYRRQVPKRYHLESLDTYVTETAEQREALEAARGFVNCVNGGGIQTLLLLGSVGTGKTHLACGIIREAGGLYRFASEIVEEFRRAKSFSAKDTEADILECYGNARLLVVDEIGRGISAEEEQCVAYKIINTRYDSLKPTVLISNYSKRDFLKYIGLAAADRLAETARMVELTGSSYRVSLKIS